LTAHFKISLVHSPRVAHHTLVGLPGLASISQTLGRSV
jgi:hypothetical protein